eukprot:1684542-Pleurochrysis_carterae.AAC.1
MSMITLGRRADTHARAWALETTATHTTKTARMTACARTRTDGTRTGVARQASRGDDRVGL